jgi:hypothetical protein
MAASLRPVAPDRACSTAHEQCRTGHTHTPAGVLPARHCACMWSARGGAGAGPQRCNTAACFACEFTFEGLAWGALDVGSMMLIKLTVYGWCAVPISSLASQALNKLDDLRLAQHVLKGPNTWVAADLDELSVPHSQLNAGMCWHYPAVCRSPCPPQLRPT